MNTIVAILLGLLLGALFMLFGVFAVVVLRRAREMETTIAKAIALLDPTVLQHMQSSGTAIAAAMPAIVGTLENVAKVVGVFNQAAFQSEGQSAARSVDLSQPPAAEFPSLRRFAQARDESSFTPYNEEEMVARQAFEQAQREKLIQRGQNPDEFDLANAVNVGNPPPSPTAQAEAMPVPPPPTVAF